MVYFERGDDPVENKRIEEFLKKNCVDSDWQYDEYGRREYLSKPEGEFIYDDEKKERWWKCRWMWIYLVIYLVIIITFLFVPKFFGVLFAFSILICIVLFIVRSFFS